MRRLWLAVAAVTATLCAARGALANGRFPASNQILFSPTTPSWIVTRTSFGIIVSKDAGASWRWICEDILGLQPTSSEDPYLGLTQNNHLVAGMSLGLQVSTDVGCDWTVIGGPLKGQFVRDLVVHKDNPHITDAITSTLGATAGSDGGMGYAQQIYESTDDGATWSPIGTPIDPSATVTTLEVAPTDPNRFYVSAFRAMGSTRTASLFVSKNKGMTWTEHQSPLDPSTESAPYIGAVDPNNEDILFLRTEAATCPDANPCPVQSRLIVTQDGGQTFKPVRTLADNMLGLALSQNGSEVYIGSTAAGLLVADTKTFTFTQTSTVHIHCLVTRGSELWACSDEVGGFEVGVSTDDGKTFTPKMHLLQIDGPADCAAHSMAAACTEWNEDAGMPYNPFVNLCGNIAACYDGGPPEPLVSACTCTGACQAFNTSIMADYDASATVCPPPKSSGGGGGSKSGCGCSAVGWRGGGAIGAAAAGLAFAIGARLRRRPRRSR